MSSSRSVIVHPLSAKRSSSGATVLSRGGERGIGARASLRRELSGLQLARRRGTPAPSRTSSIVRREELGHGGEEGAFLLDHRVVTSIGNAHQLGAIDYAREL